MAWNWDKQPTSFSFAIEPNELAKLNKEAKVVLKGRHFAKPPKEGQIIVLDARTEKIRAKILRLSAGQDPRSFDVEVEYVPSIE